MIMRNNNSWWNRLFYSPISRSWLMYPYHFQMEWIQTIQLAAGLGWLASYRFFWWAEKPASWLPHRTGTRFSHCNKFLLLDFHFLKFIFLSVEVFLKEHFLKVNPCIKTSNTIFPLPSHKKETWLCKQFFRRNIFPPEFCSHCSIVLQWSWLAPVLENL